MKLSRVAVVSVVCVSVLSCKAETPETPEKSVQTTPALNGKAAPQTAPTLQKTYEQCVGPLTDGKGKPEIHTIGKLQWELLGSTLRLRKDHGEKLVRIGTLANIKESTTDNMRNVDSFLKWFKKEKVDVVVVAGDSGLDREQLIAVFKKLAGSGLPIFSIIGNREGRADYTEALATIQAKFKNVFNLNTVRRIDMPNVDLISMPGYHNPGYIHAEDGGCPYHAKDVEALAELVKSCDSPVVLISHGAPRQKSPEGIDRTAEGENVGDPQLTAAIAKNHIPFGIFGNIHEAGGRATNLEGTRVLAQDKPFDALYLNPGPVDGVLWIMNDQTESVGMAAVMTIANGKASYHVKRLK